MANPIKKVTNVNGDTMNLGQIEIAAIRGVEQGANVLAGINQIKKLNVKTQTDTASEAISADDAGKVIVVPNVGQDLSLIHI